MRIKIYVTLKEGILDPQGKAVQHSLHTLGYTSVKDVRIGKYIEIDIGDPSKEAVEARIKEMCHKLLANPIIEDYRYEIER
ncbi:MAG: phosphoribosylformylglycinamidine synthase subunit PurS [Nitrospirae bacterium]|nr:phosphoribosylformylglycinamidine synthase subunit PurS [Nitrospirota bacterium]